MEYRDDFRRIEKLNTEKIILLLENYQMHEFIDFVRDKDIDGRKVLDVTEGIVKLWNPKANAKKFMLFVEDIKTNPAKYLETVNMQPNITKTHVLNIKETNVDNIYSEVNKVEVKTVKEHHYQTVKKVKEDKFTAAKVEELLKRIVPAKSFLYRNDVKKPGTSYAPMDAGTPKKTKNIFRLSSYDYPFFDLRKKPESNDRGYYTIKTNTKSCIEKNVKTVNSRPKYKSLASTEELNEKYPEEHFYEDLCYNDVDTECSNIKDISETNTPYKIKIQNLLQSMKLPFFKKNEEIEGEKNVDKEKRVEEDRSVEGDKSVEVEKDAHVYENTDTANMYDSVHVNTQTRSVHEQSKLPVEEYLEPVLLNKEYCDVAYKLRDDSFISYIMSVFENRFGMRRETSDDAISDSISKEEAKEEKKTNMADRPLPVPVENEIFFMDVDRDEAENLLRGTPDGTFILRPSSQPNHAYTLTVSCAGVHNIGVRRRPDGRLSLGYARRGERSFLNVTSLLRHHRKRRLMLVVAGTLIGATTLNETPQYYQTPKGLPLQL